MNASVQYTPTAAVLKPKPPLTNADLITLFEVTSDSVVGIVRLKVRDTKEFRIDWGDSTTSRVRIGSPVSGTVNNAFTLHPDGTYELRHAYEVTDDGSSFEQIILMRAVSTTGAADFRIHNLTMTPRYRVSHANISFLLLEGSESIFEDTSEWEISARTNFVRVHPEPFEVVKSTQWNFGSIPITFLSSFWYVLQGSSAARDLVKGEYLQTVLQFTEVDPIWDDHYSTAFTVNIQSPSEVIVRKVDGVLETRWYQEVRLLRPLGNQIPPVVNA